MQHFKFCQLYRNRNKKGERGKGGGEMKKEYFSSLINKRRKGFVSLYRIATKMKTVIAAITETRKAFEE